MSLLDEVDALVGGKPGPRCGAGLLLNELDEPTRADLLALLAGSARLSAIAVALKNRGHKVGAQTLGRHRKGICSCDTA